MMNGLVTFLTHPAFLSVFSAWVLVGLIKYAIALIKHPEEASLLNELMRTGGMPSGHSAAVTAIAASVWFAEGFSMLFFVTATFSLLFIRDSYGVRWSVGEQAKIINKLIKHDHLQEKVEVILGHTVFQANVGILLGLGVTVFWHLIL